MLEPLSSNVIVNYHTDDAKPIQEPLDFAKHFSIDSTALSADQLQEVKKLCNKYESIFSRHSNDLGFCDRIKHTIKLKDDHKPFRRAYGNMSFEKRKAMKKLVEDLVSTGLVEPTHSDWAAPSILVPKKDGSFRLVVDYRGLNKQIDKTCWPLPRINDVIDSLEGNLYFSNIDLTSGYFQMALSEESQNITAFITPMGLYKWKRLPMGLASAPGAFQNLMELILSGLSYEIALVYLDDIIIFGRSFKEHIQRLELVFKRLADSGLKIKGTKCKFFSQKIQFLGHVITEKGVEVDPEKVKAVQNMKTPTNLKEVRAVLGLVGFYRKFIPNFGATAEPLYKLLNKETKFTWSIECQNSMEALKSKLLSAPILGYPNDRDPYTLTTDASLTGIGAILTQRQQSEDRVIAYASKTLNKGQRNYSATKRELFAIVHFTQHFKNYLQGQKFIIVTDHRALVWLYSFKEPDGMVARWIEKLGQFNFETKHRAGKSIPHADCLSQVSATEDETRQIINALVVNPKEGSLAVNSIWTELSTTERKIIRESQKKDKVLKTVRQWVEQNERPERKNMKGASKELWKYWTQFRNLMMNDDILYRNQTLEPTDTKVQQMLIAQNNLQKILPLLHESACTGHLGVEKTYQRARERFYWPGMKRDVKEWVDSCKECLRRKITPQKHRHSLMTWTPSHPFWQVALDIMGPLPESRGNKYILLIGDQFTKWYEAVPMPNQEATTVAKAFTESWVSRFGCPANLHSDKGSNFMSNLFKNLCKELGIARTSTTSFHPQGNAIIERTNRTIEDCLAKYVGEHQYEWSNHLQLVMMAYRSSIHAVTKYSPFYLIYGHSMALPIDCMYETRESRVFPTPSDYVFNLKRELQKSHQLVREHFEAEQGRQKTYYDRGVYGPKYKVGDLVLVFFPTVKVGQTKKFTSFYHGPYRIIEIINDLNFNLHHLENNKVIKVHYDRLKKFNQRKEIITPEPQARISSREEPIDNDLVEVELPTRTPIENPEIGTGDQNAPNDFEVKEDSDSNVEETFYDFDQTVIENQKTPEVPRAPIKTFFDTPKTSPPKNTRVGHSKNKPTSSQSMTAASRTLRNRSRPEKFKDYFTEEDPEFFEDELIDSVISGKDQKNTRKK